MTDSEKRIKIGDLNAKSSCLIFNWNRSVRQTQVRAYYQSFSRINSARSIDPSRLIPRHNTRGRWCFWLWETRACWPHIFPFNKRRSNGTFTNGHAGNRGKTPENRDCSRLLAGRDVRITTRHGFRSDPFGKTDRRYRPARRVANRFDRRTISRDARNYATRAVRECLSVDDVSSGGAVRPLNGRNGPRVRRSRVELRAVSDEYDTFVYTRSVVASVVASDANVGSASCVRGFVFDFDRVLRWYTIPTWCITTGVNGRFSHCSFVAKKTSILTVNTTCNTCQRT